MCQRDIGTEHLGFIGEFRGRVENVGGIYLAEEFESGFYGVGARCTMYCVA